MISTKTLGEMVFALEALFSSTPVIVKARMSPCFEDTVKEMLLLYGPAAFIALISNLGCKT